MAADRGGEPGTYNRLALALGRDPGDFSFKRRGLRHWRYCEIVGAAKLLGVPTAVLTGGEGVPLELALRIVQEAALRGQGAD